MNEVGSVTRRGFIGGAAASAVLAAAPNVFAQGSDKIRVGVIGCGGRGSGAAYNVLAADPNVEIVALGDLFPERVKELAGRLKAEHAARAKFTDDTTFSGWDAYKKVLASNCNYVILATPPGFRPYHFQAAVEAGKNIFMEKPVAVDPNGVRKVIAASAVAQQKGLAVVAGTQRRHQAGYVETIKRIHGGAIGEVLGGQVYWNQGGLWMNPRQPEWDDMTWQLKNWLYFTWLSGDHIVEQHVHNIDVANWVMNDTPVKVYGMGGRQVRTDPAYGHCFDHFAIELEYKSGVKIQSMCRQIDGTAARVSESFIGTKGTSNPSGSINGTTRYRFEGKQVDPYVQEHIDMIASIRAGKPLNEGKRIAESCLTAIMGRIACYSGQEITFDEAMKLDLDIMPAEFKFGKLPVPPVASPGRFKLTDGTFKGL